MVLVEPVRAWGWWLRVVGENLEDRDGRMWESVRDAFWQGRLGFPHSHVTDEQHELLLRVLAAVEARGLGDVESKHDIFGGDMMMWRFFICWLASVGLVEMGHGAAALDGPLTIEGKSVLLMLEATREADWTAMPLADVVEAVRASGRTTADEQRETALRLFERQLGRMPFVFAREVLGGVPSVTLTGVGVGARMPTARVMWSQGFADRDARDDFFAWLAGRLDRWEDWGRAAYYKGSRHLTQHLLQLLVVSRIPSS